MVAATNTTDRAKSRIWLWVVVAFVVQIAAWAGLFMLAARHPVEEVPLQSERAATKGTPSPAESRRVP